MNNAGIVLWKRLEETSEAEWEHLMAVNAKGVFLGTKHAIPAMRRAGGGSIVNISSTAVLRGSPGLAAYIATKGAVRDAVPSFMTPPTREATAHCRKNEGVANPCRTGRHGLSRRNRLRWEGD